MLKHRYKLKVRGVQLLRWVFSTAFFFLAITKASLLLEHGLEPYLVLTETVGLPHVFSYYGAIAVFIELCFAVGLWLDKIFIPAILAAAMLTLLGIFISLMFIVFRFQAECGCGLLGDNEYGLLAQKLILLAGLLILYKNKQHLFVRDLAP